MEKPLADAIRPKTLDEVVGQRHLLAQGSVLRRIIEGGVNANLIFYGPSGVGKTHLMLAIKNHMKKANPHNFIYLFELYVG